MKNKTKLIVAACAIALATGCAAKNTKKPTTMAAQTTAPAPAVATNNLEGTWSLAIPRSGVQNAVVTAKDATHVTIQAGDKLSGEYAVQGNYLLILTRDENLRTIAWRINSADSLTVVRGPVDAADALNGTTLVRAATTQSAQAEEDAEISEEATAQSDESSATSDTAAAGADTAELEQ